MIKWHVSNDENTSGTASLWQFSRPLHISYGAWESLRLLFTCYAFIYYHIKEQHMRTSRDIIMIFFVKGLKMIITEITTIIAETFSLLPVMDDFGLTHLVPLYEEFLARLFSWGKCWMMVNRFKHICNTNATQMQQWQWEFSFKIQSVYIFFFKFAPENHDHAMTWKIAPYNWPSCHQQFPSTIMWCFDISDADSLNNLLNKQSSCWLVETITHKICDIIKTTITKHGLVIPTCVTARAWRTCRDACRGR